MKTHCARFVLLLFSLLALLASQAARADGPNPGDKGITRGTIVEVGPDFVLIRPAGDDLPARHYYPWVGIAGAKPDPATRAAMAQFKPGDTVEAHWSFNDRRRLDTMTPAPLPVVAATTVETPAVAPIVELNNAPPAPTATGEKVNAGIDNLVATGVRLLELPLFMLVAATSVAGIALAWAIYFLLRKRNHPRLLRTLIACEILVILLAFCFFADRKLRAVQDQITDMRNQADKQRFELFAALADRRSAPAAPATPITATPAVAVAGTAISASPSPLAPVPAPHEKRTAYLFDLAEATKSLNAAFPAGTTITPVIYDDASDIVRLHFTNPLDQAYLAVIDLKHAGLNVLIGAEENKTLTTAFAQATSSTIAINGEAGLSPALGSGIGLWRGNLVWQGKVLSREEAAYPRPYLSFDKNNAADITPAARKDRTLAATRWNVIWGRLNALIDGVIQNSEPGNRQPRTAMALNKDGTRLYLFVVDGRQQGYSIGFTHGEVATTLKAFGAYNAMLCDEGGSSCFYAKDLGGILNRPSDGSERPTYTHFGITTQ